MTTLRALVGAGFLLAVIGFVGFVPVGWALVLYTYTAEKTSAEQLKALPSFGGAHTAEIIKSRRYQRKAELVQREIVPRAANEGVMHKLVAKEK